MWPETSHVKKQLIKLLPFSLEAVSWHVRGVMKSGVLDSATNKHNDVFKSRQRVKPLVSSSKTEVRLFTFLEALNLGLVTLGVRKTITAASTDGNKGRKQKRLSVAVIICLLHSEPEAIPSWHGSSTRDDIHL